MSKYLILMVLLAGCDVPPLTTKCEIAKSYVRMTEQCMAIENCVLDKYDASNYFSDVQYIKDHCDIIMAN